METVKYNKYAHLDKYLVGSDICLIYFHGGGLEAGNKSEFKKLAEYLNLEKIDCYLPEYRLYPNAKYPEFILDVADSVAYALKEKKYKKVIIGGTSAGAYLAMMLYFDKRYLSKHNIDSEKITGYIFDAGQPTVHFNVLRENNLDSRRILVDERAPLYYLNKDVNSNVKFLVFYAEFDLLVRKEETELLKHLMLNYGYKEENLNFHLVKNNKHCEYTNTEFFNKTVLDFIKKL
ncbi:MAG: alpha/beta hydrolase [Acholeplasmatales bacterium]